MAKAATRRRGDRERDEEEAAPHRGLTLGAGVLELDADAAHGVQVARARWPISPSLRRSHDRWTSIGLVGAAVGLAPHLGEQLAPRDHLGRAAGEVGEQVELEAATARAAAPARVAVAAVGVDHEVADHERRPASPSPAVAAGAARPGCGRRAGPPSTA